MTHLDQTIADALAQSPDTVVHQLASEVVRLRGELEAARAEIADLKRGVVVVPEWPLDGHDDRLDEIRCWKSDPIRGVVEWNAINRTVAWMRARLRPIPADRVLGDVIRRIAETKLEEDEDGEEMSWDASYTKLSAIVNDCRVAIKSKITQELAP